MVDRNRLTRWPTTEPILLVSTNTKEMVSTYLTSRSLLRAHQLSQVKACSLLRCRIRKRFPHSPEWQQQQLSLMGCQRSSLTFVFRTIVLATAYNSTQSLANTNSRDV